MIVNTPQDNFSEFGHIFQTKVITLLLFDKEFLPQVLDIMKKEYFDSDEGQWVYESIKKYFDTYRVLPTVDALVIEWKNIQHETLSEAVQKILREATLVHKDATDLPSVKDKAVEFCKNQELKNATLDMVDMLEKKNYDGMRSRIDAAFKAGSDRNLGHIYMEQLEFRLSDAARLCVATPWDVINDITDGGSASGDLFVIVAPPGIGKTWALACVGASALKHGKTIIHYSMELQEAYVGRRYDSILSGVALQNLKYHKDEVAKSLSEYDGRLIVKYYPPKFATVNTLRSHVDKCILHGYKPDLIIVDYADLVKPTAGHKEVRHGLENIYEDLRSMAGESKLPIWSASQANRCHDISDYVNTPNGNVTLGNIKVGDFVDTHLGYKKVLFISEIESQPVYKITLKSGKTITISINHEVPVLWGKLKSIISGLSVGDKLFTKK